jgi:hypothetical protein
MDQVTTLQHLEYLETGFEVSKRLAQAGYQMDAPALVITWGQVAEVIAHTLADYGIPPDRLEDERYREMVQSVQQALRGDKGTGWRDLVRLSVTSTPGILSLLEPLDIQDDEGPLTELYENATRIGDDESY